MAWLLQAQAHPRPNFSTSQAPLLRVPQEPGAVCTNYIMRFQREQEGTQELLIAGILLCTQGHVKHWVI